MLRPAMSEILKKDQSYYSLVVAVAKRAREISDEAEKNHQIIVEKPVKIAVNEMYEHKYKFIEDPSLKEK